MRGAKAIAKVPENNTTLTSIDLSATNIGDEGASAIAIAKALENNTTLTSINLSSEWNRECAIAAAAALALNK